MNKMDGKVVLVTGSSSGIGEEIALSFAKLNCQVIIHGRNQERIEHVASKCESCSPSNIKPLTVNANFERSEEIAKLFTQVVERHNKLDILVNNAGLYKNFKIDSENAYERYKTIMDININSVVQLTSLAVPLLKISRGSIINISSNLAIRSANGTFAYSTAKAALSMFTKTMAIDLAPEIRVNSVSPGPVATLSIDADSFRKAVGHACLTGRVGEVYEIARVVIFLASPDSAFITGTDIVVDGGSLIKQELIRKTTPSSY